MLFDPCPQTHPPMIYLPNKEDHSVKLKYRLSFCTIIKPERTAAPWILHRWMGIVIRAIAFSLRSAEPDFSTNETALRSEGACLPIISKVPRHAVRTSDIWNTTENVAWVKSVGRHKSLSVKKLPTFESLTPSIFPRFRRYFCRQLGFVFRCYIYCSCFS